MTIKYYILLGYILHVDLAHMMLFCFKVCVKEFLGLCSWGCRVLLDGWRDGWGRGGW